MLRQPFRQTMADGTAFYLRHPENLLLVKRESGGGWLVCAMMDNLTTAQQTSFIGYLCTEGFISATFEPMNSFRERTTPWLEPPVRWIVDPSWSEVDPVYARHLRRLRWCLAGSMVVWLAVIIVLFYC